MEITKEQIKTLCEAAGFSLSEEKMSEYERDLNLFLEAVELAVSAEYED